MGIHVSKPQNHLCLFHQLCPDDHIVPERARCLGCPIEIDENSEDIKVPLSFSISNYNSISNSTHLFSLNNIGHATRQVKALGVDLVGGEREEKVWSVQMFGGLPGGGGFQI